MPDREKPIPISRSLGRFFGHLWHATTKPVPPEAETEETTRAARTTTEVGETEVAGQKAILRRTTIEEIEIQAPRSDPTD